MSFAESRALIADVVAGALSDPSEMTGDDFSERWRVATSLGWSAVGVPEGLGGAGGSFVDLLALAHAVSRSGGGVPVAETALARWAIGGMSSSADGQVSTVAVRSQVAIDHKADGVAALTGRLEKVAWATRAAEIVVVGPSWCATVATDAPGIVVMAPSSRLGEPRSDVKLDDVRATVLPRGGLSELVRNRLSLLRVAAMLGAAEGALDLTKRHVTTREQFGRALARFQLVAATIADMATQIALVAGTLDVASAGVDGPEGTLRCAAATMVAHDCARRVARGAHQLHGAIGITREYPLHRFTGGLWFWSDDCESERTWEERMGEILCDNGSEQLWNAGGPS